MHLSRRSLLACSALAAAVAAAEPWAAPAGWTVEVLTPTGRASLARSAVALRDGVLAASFAVDRPTTARAVVVRHRGVERHRWWLEPLEVAAGGSVELQLNPRG